MFWTMSVILLGLWGFGLMSGASLGWWLHGLLAMSLVSAVLGLSTIDRRVVHGRRERIPGARGGRPRLEPRAPTPSTPRL